MELQTTLAFIGGTGVEKTASIRSDLVDCVDCEEKIERSEATKTVDGFYYADPNKVPSCDSCCDPISQEFFEHKHGLCESCYDDTYTECIACTDEMLKEDCIDNESGDDYCSDCYNDTYFQCNECGDETNCNISNENNGSLYCSSCYEEQVNTTIEVPRSWKGSNNCIKLGSLRKFGIELESSECDDYKRWLDRRTFGVVTDGSIKGMEFVSAPIYGDEGIDAVRDFCHNANSSGFKIDNNCSFHLHCDLSDTNANQRKSIALAYHYTREIWHEFIEKRRRDTYYSQMNCGTSHTSRDHWNRRSIIYAHDIPYPSERYIWINLKAWEKHKTIEVRSHHPTFNADDVCNWVKAHLMFIDAMTKLTVGKVTRMLGNEDNGKQFIELSFIWKDRELSEFYGGKRREYSKV